jgi:hypothetical protein
MDLISLVAGFVLGVVVGGGAIVFYVRWKMNQQLNAMQENMEGMFDATEEMMGEFDSERPVSDLEEEEKE